MTYLSNSKIASELYGQTCGPLTSVYLVTEASSKGICILNLLNNGAPVIEVTLQSPVFSHVNHEKLTAIQKCEFVDLADAFENQHKIAENGEFLHQAGRVFWSELFPGIYRAMRLSSTLDIEDQILGLMKINFDSINGIQVACAFEALTFAMAYGYLAYLKAINHRSSSPKEMQTSEELQTAPFGKSARIVFRGLNYKVEMP